MSLDLSEESVLVVDDVAFNRDIIRQLLRSLGVREIYDARDGQEALEILADNPETVNFVIADFNMPVMHGLQLLKAVRMGEHRIDRSIPFAMLTAFSDVELVEAALALDVNAFLVKPVSKATFEKRLAAMLENAVGDDWLRSVENYETVDVSTAKIREYQKRNLTPARNRLKCLDTLAEDSPAARRINMAITHLTNESGEVVTERICQALDEFVDRGALRADQLAQILSLIELEGRGRGEGPTVQHDDLTAGSGGLSIPQLTADQDRLEQLLEDVRNGAALKIDVRTADGKLFIEAGTDMTPRVISIMINLDDLGLLENVQEALSNLQRNTAPAGGGGQVVRPAQSERRCRFHELKEGDVISREVTTGDGRPYMHAGTELTPKFLEKLSVAMELGHVDEYVWVRPA